MSAQPHALHIDIPVKLAGASLQFPRADHLATAPGIDVEHSIGRDHHMADMADIVGEDGRTEPGGERDAGIVTDAGLRALRTRLGESGLDEREGDSK